MRMDIPNLLATSPKAFLLRHCVRVTFQDRRWPAPLYTEGGRNDEKKKKRERIEGRRRRRKRENDKEKK